MDNQWISIMEYANLKGLSISSVRRRIKANIVNHKMENGKYFIWTPKSDQLTQDQSVEEEITRLKEENVELKMLVNLYEKQLAEVNKERVH